MRHIKSMTREELNAMINKIEKEKLAVVSTDKIRWHELYNLKSLLEDEAVKRAKTIGTSHTALSLGVIV